MEGQRFFVAEVEIFRPAGGALLRALGMSTTALSTLSLTPTPIEATSTIFASDLGYVDQTGPTPYPPDIAEAFAIDRRVSLDPSDSQSSVSWGSISLSNDSGRFDAIVSSWNSAGRPVRILRGVKSYDATRGLWLDPDYADLVPIFIGVAGPWHLNETTLDIPLRDASLLLAKPVQSRLYLGSGTYEGTADMAGRPMPKLRGTAWNITPDLIDPVNLIYRYSDGPTTMGTIYEGDAAVFIDDGDVADLYTGAVASGHSRTDNSRGLFQLGATPVGTITVDASGAFPVAGAQTVLADIARYLMTEDMSLPAGNIDTTSFDDAATAYPYDGGVYFAPDDNVSGSIAVFRVLSSFGAKVISARTGEIRCLVLRALTGAETPVARFDTTNLVTLKPIGLPASLDPPIYRARVAYQHNYTVQTTGFLGAATAARQLFVAAADRFAGWTDGAVSLAYAGNANDLRPFGGALTDQADAVAVADDTGALFGTRRRLLAATLPTSVGVERDIGDVVTVQYPMDDLRRSARPAQVLGDQFRSASDTITLMVFV